MNAFGLAPVYYCSMKVIRGHNNFLTVINVVIRV